MDKKSVKLLTIANFSYFNNIYCKPCSNSGKGTTENYQGNEDSQGTGQNPNDPVKDKEKDKEKDKNKDNKKDKDNKEKYIEKTKELRDKFTGYNKIINGKDINNISETVSNHLCGFFNYGCTCYFNAAIQNLTHNKELVKAILDYVAGIADKGTVDIEIIAFYYLIVKIYEQEEERKIDNNKKTVIKEELGNLRFFIALKGIDIDKANDDRIKNFLNDSKQSDSSELLTNLIEDIRTIIDEEDKVKENTYKKDIIQNILFFNSITTTKCQNDKCTSEEEKKNSYLSTAAVEIKNENLNENLKSFASVDKDDSLSECDICSKEKSDEYKKKHNEKILDKLKEFKNCKNCKKYFDETENYTKNNKFSEGFENSTKSKDGYRFYQDKDKKIILASLLTDKTTGLTYNNRCDECKKKHEEFSKNFINYRNKSIKLEFNGKYFIVQNKKFEMDYETMTPKKIEKDINFEENLKLEPKEYNVEREINFNLVGIICHSGTADGGHYFSYNKIGNKWYKFNDSSVKEVPNNKIVDVENIKSLNYVLFYKKQ